MELIKPQKGTNYNIENDIQNLTNIEQEFEQIDNKITNDISSSIDELKDKVDNDIATAITELDNKVDTEIVTAIDNLETKVNTEISESITALDNKVTTSLQEQAESLKKEISDQIAKVVANSPEDFDTLKEISDWISGHSSDASTMNSAISGNTSAINQEILDRQAADAALQTNIDKKVDKDLSNVTGVLPISKGGTGATTKKSAQYYLLNNMNDLTDSVSESEFINTTSIVCAYENNGNSTLGTIYKRDCSKLWNYIKYKISSVLGLTSSNYDGKAATAGTADTAKACSGNAATATKATQDGSGNNIVNTYIKSLSVSGKTITYTKGNNSTGTITTQDTTYSAATQSAAGLMSAADKTKLDGIAAGANKTTVDSTLSSTSTNPVQNKVINTALNNKVDKVSGKGLSTNDYTTTEKNKLAGIAEGANKTVVDSSLSSTSTNPVQNKVVQDALNNKASSNHTHTSLKRTQIASGTNLNNLTTPGEYYAIDNTTYTNAPCQNFTMQVITLMAGYIFQILYAYSSSRIYTRSTMYNGGSVAWTSWVQSASTTDYLKIRTSAPAEPKAGDIWIG